MLRVGVTVSGRWQRAKESESERINLWQALVPPLPTKFDEEHEQQRARNEVVDRDEDEEHDERGARESGNSLARRQAGSEGVRQCGPSARAMAALSACGAVLPGLRSSLVPAAASRSSDASSSSSCSSTSAACAVKSSGSARRGGIVAGSYSLHQRGAPACTSGFKGVTLPIVSTSSSTSRASRRAPLSARSALVQKVTAKELDDILTNARTSPMIIDFYATWCGPCIVLAQQLEQLAVEYGDDVRFLKVDTDEEHELATQMEIRGLPTMVFVSVDTEKLAIRTEGLLPTETIRNIIEKEL